MTAALSGLSEDGSAFLMKMHLDQTAQQLCILLPEQKLAELLEAWKVKHNDGEDPRPGEEASSNQIPAMNARFNTGGRPYGDFAIWNRTRTKYRKHLCSQHVYLFQMAPSMRWKFAGPNLWVCG